MKILEDYDLYESVEELKKDMEIGLDIEFDFHGVSYWLGRNSRGYVIAVCGDEDEGAVFARADGLLDGYTLDGVSLRTIASEIQVSAH